VKGNRKGLRFFANVKVLLQQLDEAELDDNVSPCTFLNSGKSNARQRIGNLIRNGKRTNLDGLEYFGLDVDGQVLAG
jgi:hypothetical protein